MGFDWLTSWLGGGGKRDGTSRRARRAVPLAALLVAAGLAAADPLPVAPPPREATPAKAKVDPKLLHGKWRAVAAVPNILGPNVTITFEFNEYGRYKAEVLIVGDPPQHDAGAYVVDGDSVLFQPDLPALPAKPTWGWTVTSLTPDRLDFAGQGKQDHHRLFFVRVRGK